MNTKETTPWALIRWMVALLGFGLTVAISIDQVRDRDARISELEENLDASKSHTKDALKLAREATAKGRESADVMVAKLEQLRVKSFASG